MTTHILYFHTAPTDGYETVNLFSDNTLTNLLGSAVISGLPSDRYPSDLGWLAPVIQTPDSRVWLFQDTFGYGPQPTPSYILVSLIQVASAPTPST
jgi:hypothetical protein